MSARLAIPNAINIEANDKVAILLAALGERYNSIRLIRARVENIGVWVIGLALAAGGWLLQSSAALSATQRVVLILGTLIALGAIRFCYLADLHRRFLKQQRSSVRLEEVLGLYERGLFDSTNEPIYPQAWKAAGTVLSHGKFFRSASLLIYIAAAFLVASILACGAIAANTGAP
jgi:hypothetical protein